MGVKKKTAPEPQKLDTELFDQLREERRNFIFQLAAHLDITEAAVKRMRRVDGYGKNKNSQKNVVSANKWMERISAK